MVIPNPVFTDLTSPYKEMHEKAIVLACRLTSQKNVPMSIEAFAKLHKDHSDYVLDIYGEGDLRDKLEDLINRKGLCECVWCMV